MLKLTVSHKGQTENGLNLKIGQVFEYLGHVPGGCVKIRTKKGEDLAHPGCFEELCDD